MEKNFFNNLSLSQKLHFLLGTGFFSGFSEFCPGTIGTITAIPIIYFFKSTLPLTLNLLILITSILYGTFICYETDILLKKTDAPEIVFDEWVGIYITLFPFNLSIKVIFLGFIIFRIFDIIKPFPIKIVDTIGGKGIGVMLDDVIAGIYSLISLGIIITITQ